MKRPYYRKRAILQKGVLFRHRLLEAKNVEKVLKEGGFSGKIIKVGINGRFMEKYTFPLHKSKCPAGYGDTGG